MKILIILASILTFAVAGTEKQQWQDFKLKHGKAYKSLLEEHQRFQTFKSNLEIIENHNEKYQKGLETYYMGVNKFSDLTDEEFKLYLNYKKVESEGEIFKKSQDFLAPNELDWRDLGVVSDVKDQGSCGACWAFSATGSLESQYAIRFNKSISLSEQELMDCSTDYGNEGCAGGEMTYAFSYIKDRGISTEESCPYTAENGTDCKTGEDSGVKITGYIQVEKGKENLRDAVASVGPISVGIHGDNIRHYAGGLYNDILCLGLSLDHAVLAIGYGHLNISAFVDYDYWILKNSWGTSWGEGGYIRMVRNLDMQCGIGSDSVYPTL